jgi:hypothetical protein
MKCQAYILAHLAGTLFCRFQSSADIGNRPEDLQTELT